MILVFKVFKFSFTLLIMSLLFIGAKSIRDVGEINKIPRDALCCGNGQCNGADCDEASDAWVWEMIDPYEKHCYELLFTCKDCMDLGKSLEWKCDDKPFNTMPTYCFDENGDKYYGVYQDFGEHPAIESLNK
jgi:hypothetical protein